MLTSGQANFLMMVANEGRGVGFGTTLGLTTAPPEGVELQPIMSRRGTHEP